MSARTSAAAAARRGWSVFPCRPSDKRPAVDRWEARACADPERVARFWPSDHHNVGIACGPSGLVVIDLDVSPDDALGASDQLAPHGAQQLARIVKELGQPWPDTLTVSTPRGGWHLYFLAPDGQAIRNSASKIAPKIDVRAAGGYVVGPGSIVGGKPYSVSDTGALDPVPLPDWLAALAAPPAPQRGPALPGDGSAFGRLRGVVSVVLDAQPGERNKCLHWAACRAAEMVDAGQLDQAAAVAALSHAAGEIGLGDRETQATIRSGMRGVAI